jgi:hypothetical protein
MKDWHRSGWICPNYIYQWLFEVGNVMSGNDIIIDLAIKVVFF